MLNELDNLDIDIEEDDDIEPELFNDILNNYIEAKYKDKTTLHNQEINNIINHLSLKYSDIDIYNQIPNLTEKQFQSICSKYNNVET